MRSLHAVCVLYRWPGILSRSSSQNVYSGKVLQTCGQLDRETLFMQIWGTFANQFTLTLPNRNSISSVSLFLFVNTLQQRERKAKWHFKLNNNICENVKLGVIQNNNWTNYIRTSEFRETTARNFPTMKLTELGNIVHCSVVLSNTSFGAETNLWMICFVSAKDPIIGQYSTK